MEFTFEKSTPASAGAAPRAALDPISLARLRSACSSCNLRELCMPVGIAPERIDSLDELIYTRRRVPRGQGLFRAKDDFRSLYAVRVGFFKTVVATPDGRGQVTGFQMSGEILGMDGIGAGHHACDAIALEDSEACVMPYSKLEELSTQFPSLTQHFHRVMSREIVRDQGVMLLLGSMRADERLAAFLVNLSQRFAMRGFAAAEFHLRMSREEIGSYLGLKLETVSRAFSKFQDDGLLAVKQKHVRIVDMARLHALAAPPC